VTIPYTSISLGFHSQIEPTRTELHQDTRGTFARFGITPATYKAFLQANQAAGSKRVEAELAPAEKMLETAIEIEKESEKVRNAGGNQAVVPLPKLIDEFLRMAASWVAAEVALGISEPDQPVCAEPGEFIRRMYLLLYSADFRSKPDSGKFDPTAWKAVLTAVEHGSAPFDELLPHCQLLCSQVAAEFTASLWPWIW
jgi:hypothetical protein